MEVNAITLHSDTVVTLLRATDSMDKIKHKPRLSRTVSMRNQRLTPQTVQI